MWEHPCVDCAELIYFVQRLFQYGCLLPLPAVCAGHYTLDRECGDEAAVPAPRALGRDGGFCDPLGPTVEQRQSENFSGNCDGGGTWSPLLELKQAVSSHLGVHAGKKAAMVVPSPPLTHLTNNSVWPLRWDQAFYVYTLS